MAGRPAPKAAVQPATSIGGFLLSFVKKASTVFLTRFMMFAVAMVNSVIVARTLGPEGKGLLSLSILAATVLCYSTNLGIGTGSGFFLGRKRLPLRVLAGNWLSLSVLIGVSVTAAAVLLSGRISQKVLPSVPAAYITIAVCSVPFMITRNNLQSLFKAGDDFRRFNLTDIVQPVVFLLTFLSLFFLLRERGVLAAVIAIPVSHAVSSIVAAVLLGQKTKLRFEWSGPVVKDAFRFGVRGYLAGLIEFLNLRLDMLLINLIMAPQFVGFYSIAVALAEKVWYVPTVLSIVLYPRVAHGEARKAGLETSKVCRQTILIIIICCAVILMAGRFIIELLYSEAFSPAIIPLFILLPGILTAGISRIISSDLMARGYPGIILWSGLSALATNIILNLVFIPDMGVEGAALATVISYSLNAMILVLAFIRISGLAAREILVPGKEDINVLLASVKKIASISTWR